MLEKTIKCPICGRSYKFMPYYAGDQSACPACQQKVKDNMKAPEQWNGDGRKIRYGRTGA